jgi:probable rRNA maturation factor
VRVQLHNETRAAASRDSIRPRVLTRQLQQVLAWLGVAHGHWSITLVHDSAMRKLHQQVMQDDSTTDVLTFDLRDKPARRRKAVGAAPPPADPLDLDTVISLDEARRRAAELDHPAHDEVLLYAVHSLLHVLGYDDRTPAHARRMHHREDELLVRLGVGPVYARQSLPARRGKS